MNRNRPSYRLGPGAAVNNNNGTTAAAAAGGGHRRTVSSSSGVGRLTPVSLASKPVPPPASMQPRGSIVRQNNFTEEMAQSSHVLGGTSFGRPPTLPPTASSTTAAAAGKRRSKKKDDINTTPTTTTTTTSNNNNSTNTTVSNGAAADETTPRIAKKSKKSTVGSPGLAKLPAGGGGGGTTRGSPIMKAGAGSPRGNTLSQAKRSTTTKRISGSTDALPSNGNGKMNNNNNGNSAGSNGRSMLDELPSRPFSDRGSQRPLPLESRPEAAEPEKPLTAPSMLHQQQTDLNLPRLRKGSTAASSPKMAGRRRLPSILVSTGGGVPHPLNTEADSIAPASSVAAIPLRTRTASLSGGLESCGAHSEGATPQSHRGVTPRSGAQRGSLNPIQGVSPPVSSRATSVSPAASAGTGALMGQRRPSFGSAAFSTQSRSNSATPNLMQYPTSCATSARSSVSGWSGASSAAEESEADDDDDSTDDDDEEDDDDVTAQDEESSDDSDDSSEESEEESESDDESDGGAHRHHRRRRGSRRADDKMLVTKVSREGDLNMKVLTINQRTKFRHYVKDVMKRFGYKQPTDFDMYCIDPSGDRVDVDIEEDFKDLTHRFWSRQKEMRAAQHKKHHGGDAQAAAAAAAAAARGRLGGGGGDSARHTVDERSSDTFIRLYVRDSYTYRMSKIPPVNTSTPVSTSSPNQNTVNTLLISTTKSYGSSPSDAHAFDSPSNMALQFAETQRNQLLSTISFKETEEVQWTRMSVLGRGSFGTVYEGITADGKIMAVKVQEIPLNEDSEETKALQMEINLMRSLKHKNIVAYYGCQTRDLSDTSKQMEIFLELCHGGSLAHLRKKFDKAHEPFTISLVRSYTRQILEGLSYLHSRNVMHRDIKSDNVLISAMGEAKLADFGCSKRIGTTTLAADQKAGGAYQTMVGSPIFMAPEVMKGDCGYSMPADVWSVGCLVLELLGRDPWKLDTGNVFQVMFRISQSKGMPTGVPSKCPPTLLDFFEKCFERDPDKRATAAQLLKHKWITCSDSSLEAVPPEDDAPTAAAASA